MATAASRARARRSASRATVPVVPTPELADWTTLEVGVPEAEVPGEIVDAELDRLREAAAELVAGRRPPGAARRRRRPRPRRATRSAPPQRDYVVEIGSGRLVDEIEAALVGMSAGETKEVEFELADEQKATVTVSVNEIKEKVLPPLDDDLAQAVSEFETLAELRADIEAQLREQLEGRAGAASFRQDAVDALVEASTFDSLEPLVERRTAELRDRLRPLARAAGHRPRDVSGR